MPATLAIVDDATVSRGHHRQRSGSATQKATGQVRLDNFIPLLVGHARQQGIAGDASVVQQDIQLAVLFMDIGKQFLDGGSIANIAWHSHGLATSGFDFCNHSGQLSALRATHTTVAPFSAMRMAQVRRESCEAPVTDGDLAG